MAARAVRVFDQARVVQVCRLNRVRRVFLGIQVREADLAADSERIAGALSKYLTPLADRPRFEWLYRRNPHGRVRVWLAIDDEGELVGTAAAFPRRLYMAQEEKTGWVFGDFCVSDRYRSLGPALMLQRALLDAVKTGAVALGYDFPSSAMMAVYKRLGIKPSGRMVRLAKPVRVDRMVRQRIKSTPLAETISALGNIVLSVRNRRSQHDPTLTFELHERRCEEEFTALAESLKSVYGHCVRRSAEYLNWRYFENPYCKLGMITARRSGKLVGFTVFARIDEDGVIVDLFGQNEPAILRHLIGEAGQYLKEQKVVTLSAELLESHPWVPIFKEAGFMPRDDKPLVVYWSPTEPSRSESFNHGNWYLMGGDRDS
ncbi:MAG TPA: GNAT family N-acetyltransferase [Candidatus Binatia bacterium]|jgi:GNAT superfamily N-acetyltransferase